MHYHVTLNGTPNFSVNQTDQMMKALVDNDKETNLLLEYGRVMLEKKRQAGSPNVVLENQYQNILDRYVTRQNEIKNSRLIKVQGYIGNALSYFKNIFGLGSLGGLPRVPPAIAVLFGLPGLSLAIYQFFQPRYQQSTRDLKESKELRALLESADPQTAADIRADLENQIDEAYTTGKRSGQFSGILGTIKLVALIGGALFIIHKLFPNAATVISKHPMLAKGKKLLST